MQLSACWRPRKVYGTCNLCHTDFDDRLVHSFCSRMGTADVRDSLWCEIINCSPIEVSVARHSNDDIHVELVCLLLSCQPPVALTSEETLLYVKTVIKHISLFNKLVFY